jgi:heptosyltransferase-2
VTPRAVPVPAGGFRRIAVIRLSSLGDVVLTLPAVAALRAAWPQAHIDYWVKEEFADVLRHDPRVDHVRALDRDARRLEDLVSMSAELEGRDLIVDLHGSARSRVLTFRQRAPVLRAASYRVRRARWVHARWSGPPPVPHALERYARALAPLGIEPRGVPEMAVGAEAEAWASTWWAAWAPAAPPLAVLPAARHATKRWPESHWLALDAALASAGVPRLYCSLPAERDGLAALAGQAARGGARWCTEPLPRMAALLSRCDGAVGGDTGLTHVAAARGLKVVALFGSTSPVLGFAPAGAGHQVLCRQEPCQPCTLHGREACPLGHFHCMTALGAAEVLESIRRIRRAA